MDCDDSDVDKPFILWTNFGSYEGWSPRGFDSKEQILDYIVRYGVHGPIAVTKRLDIFIKDE